MESLAALGAKACLIFMNSASNAQFVLDKDLLKPVAESFSLYNKLLQPWLQELGAGLMMTSGMPMRGTELATLLFMNDPDTIREIQIEQGQFRIATMYSKSRNRTGQSKIIFRYVAPAYGKLLLAYIICIRQIYRFLAGWRKVYVPHLAKSEGLELLISSRRLFPTADLTHAGRIPVSANATLGMRIMMERVLMPSLGSRIWRQLSKTIGRNCLGIKVRQDLNSLDKDILGYDKDRKEEDLFLEPEALDNEGDEDNEASDDEFSTVGRAIDQQHGHGHKTGLQHYGVTLNELQQYSVNAHPVYKQASKALQTFLLGNIDQNGLTSENKLAELDQIPLDGIDFQVPDVLSQGMADLIIKSRGNVDSIFTKDESYSDGLEDSDLIAITEAVESDTSRAQKKGHSKRNVSAISKMSSAVPFKKIRLEQDTCSTIDTEALTKKELICITGAETYLSSQQGRWCQFLQKMPQESSLSLIIMPTGGGKSLLFMLPASLDYVSQGITIVIVPFRVLLSDLLRRCKEKNISAVLWETYRYQLQSAQVVPSVLLISAESTRSDGFIHWVGLRMQEKSIQRIFFDECHVVLDAYYRESLLDLSYLSSLAVPLVLLSATVPIKYEETIINSFGRTFDPSRAGQTKISDRKDKESANVTLKYVSHADTVDRCKTTQQLNIQYEILHLPQSVSLAKGLQNLLHHCMSSLEHTAERILVYFNTIYKLNDMRSFLKDAEGQLNSVYTYHRQNSDDINGQNMKEWLANSNQPVMFATAALGCGLDYGRI